MPVGVDGAVTYVICDERVFTKKLGLALRRFTIAGVTVFKACPPDLCLLRGASGLQTSQANAVIITRPRARRSAVEDKKRRRWIELASQSSMKVLRPPPPVILVISPSSLSSSLDDLGEVARRAGSSTPRLMSFVLRIAFWSSADNDAAQSMMNKRPPVFGPSRPLPDDRRRGRTPCTPIARPSSRPTA